MRIRAARQAARRVLHRFGVRAPEHIQLDAIARALGAEIVEGPLDGATARLVRVGGRARIRLSDRVTHPGARRFSVGHELGHLVLGHESRPVSAICAEPAPPTADDRDHEAEANAFAAELLMPEALVRRRCEVSPVSMAAPRSIADAFATSLLASALRFVELTSERAAAVYSERGAITWAARSPTFRPFLHRGKRLDPDSVAHDHFCGAGMDDAAQSVPADAWFDSEAGGVDIVEHTVPIAETAAALTLLWIPERAAADLGFAD